MLEKNLETQNAPKNNHNNKLWQWLIAVKKYLRYIVIFIYKKILQFYIYCKKNKISHYCVKKFKTIISSKLTKRIISKIKIYYEIIIAKHKNKPQEKRRHFLKLSFILVVLLPSFFGIIYYTFVASDRYVSSVGFAIRNANNGGDIDSLGVFSGFVNTGSTVSDSHVLIKYLKSRDVLEKLQQDFDFLKAYSNKKIDFISRANKKSTVEKLLDYWNDNLSINFEARTGIMLLEIEAFQAKDAQIIAKLLYQYAQEIVNKLADQARKDAVSFAEKELTRSETRFKLAMDNMRKFREKQQVIDPQNYIKTHGKILAMLEQKLLNIMERISELKGELDENSPPMQKLRRKQDALKEQIKNKLTKNDADNHLNIKSLSTLLDNYEGLELEKQFAQKSYTSALVSLEKARIDAMWQHHRYLATYSVPDLPEYPIYPKRINNIILVIFLSLALWGIGVLFSYSIRDHL